MKWLIAINLQFSNELGYMNFIYSNSVGKVELLLHRREKDMSVLQKKELEPHSTYLSNRPQVSMVYRLINHAGCW